jgi:dihydroflavonol-4-reductase
MLKGLLPVYVDGGIHYVDVRDAADGLIKCLDRGEPGRKYIIGGYNLTWAEFFALASKVSGRPAPRFKLNYRLGTLAGRWMERFGLGKLLAEGDIELAGQSWFYDSSRSIEELGLQLRPLEETLRDGIDWLRAEGLAG